MSSRHPVPPRIRCRARHRPTGPCSGRLRPAASVAALVAVVAVVAVGCGGDGDSQAVKSSPARPSTTSTPDGGSGSSDEFCAELARIDTETADAQDPAALVEALAGLRRSAPPEVADDLEVLSGAAEDLASLDEDDPASMARLIELLMAPEVMEASTAVEDYARTTCGLELGGDTSTGDTGTGSTVPDGSSADLELEDIDAVEEANASAAWPDKISGTTISMNTDVQLYADESAGLTAAEALEACTAVRAALVVKNPDVTVVVSSGERTLAGSPAGGECAPA